MSTPAYVKVSKTFRIGRSAEANYNGVVIASPEAFYFVLGRIELAVNDIYDRMPIDQQHLVARP